MPEKTNSLATVLISDRVTKGAVRFMEAKDEFPINLYLRKDQVVALGLAVEEGISLNLSLSS